MNFTGRTDRVVRVGHDQTVKPPVLLSPIAHSLLAVDVNQEVEATTDSA